jgi:hypothetical protein
MVYLRNKFLIQNWSQTNQVSRSGIVLAFFAFVGIGRFVIGVAVVIRRVVSHSKKVFV